VLSISKPLSSGQALSYHKMEFTSETQSYYKQDGAVRGEWQGRLAEKMGLAGAVSPEEFARLAEGRHPQSDEQMVRHREPQAKNTDGTTTNAVEHRAGWDATFSAPKSVSLTALVGGDERVREAHRAAVTTALAELERYTQARIGGNNVAETTGRFIAAKFEHDTARPVEGYAAPQLHTHAVIFNVTERADGSWRAVQPLSFFDSQNYATAVYQSALTYQLRKLGYEIEAGKSGAPEIKGYSQEYLDASSARSQQIKEHLEKFGYSGPEAAQIAAHATRDSKQILTPEQVINAHKEVAALYGNQATWVVVDARERAQSQVHHPDEISKAKEAISYARSSNFEREAVTDERTLMRDALRRGMGETTFAHVRAEFHDREARGDFKTLEGQKHATGRSFSTPETIANERANVAHVMRGQNTIDPMMTHEHATAQAAIRGFLNAAQRRAIEDVLTSPDRIHGLQGLAGAGKTSVLSSVREGAEQSGYVVEGFAPTSRAASQLRDAGINATTLQSFLARGQGIADPASRHLYMLDESSLSSTKQMRLFLDKIGPPDRVLLIGDVRQHQGVDAGRPFEQMQDAGMRTSRLDEIMRQKDPALLKAVHHLALGETKQGIAMLGEQGRITEIVNPQDRIMAIAKDYAARPDNTIIISPDNRSRQLINQAVRIELQTAGRLAKDNQEFRTLVHRSDMTGADREWAARYQPGDVLKYTTGSKAQGIARDSVSTVVSTSARNNTITVESEQGQSVTYDPRRLRGVNVYREVLREFAAGERIQFTARDKEFDVNNRDLATITKIDSTQITVRLDGQDERTFSFDPSKMRHFDHGYAVTSHSAQGLTEGRVIANIDTESSRFLINSRLAYVSISRASEDARIYTNDAGSLGTKLATEITKTAAIDFRQAAFNKQRDTPEPAVHEYADPSHKLAAVASAYAERPDSTIVVAPDRTERQELNQLIRADLQAQGRLSSDSRSFTVAVEKTLSNPRLAEQYTPGDRIEFRQGSQNEGIVNNSAVVVLAIDFKSNQLTVQTSAGDEITYNPHLTKAMTSQSTVYRFEQREIAVGERIHVNEGNSTLGIRKGEFGTVTAISDANDLEMRLDRGTIVHLNEEQARRIDHGYAVQNLKSGAPQRILVSHEAGSDQRESNSLARNAREVNIYTSQGPGQVLTTSRESLQATHPESPANVVVPEPLHVEHRRSIGR
jgi:conjugative relaxase-like TrwC/TraI family protein